MKGEMAEEEMYLRVLCCIRTVDSCLFCFLLHFGLFYILFILFYFIFFVVVLFGFPTPFAFIIPRCVRSVTRGRFAAATFVPQGAAPEAAATATKGTSQATNAGCARANKLKPEQKSCRAVENHEITQQRVWT